MLIEIKNLTFAYPKQGASALEGINVNAADGSFVTLCGRSGSGKSTLLRMLKPALSPKGNKEGEIYFCGSRLENCNERQLASDIGFVSQSPDNQIVTDKVWHEMSFAMESLGYDSKIIKQRVSEMAMFFGIQGWFHKDVNELSGGQKQILCLASAMTLLPKVILLDEPTSQLDPIAASEFIGMLKKINEELGITIIIAEHRLEEIITLSDKVVVLDSGRIIAEGSPIAVCSQLKSQKHVMAEAMPVPVRVWSAVKDNDNMRQQCPLDVKTGRQWLKEYIQYSPNMEKLYTDENASEKDMGSKRPALIAKGLYFHYERDKCEILKDTSFKVYEGEIYCILGGNGTGKSTLMSVAASLRKPQRGSIATFGKKVGMLPQNPKTLFVKKTVRENLEDIGSSESDLKGVIEVCALAGLLHRHPYDLSGGEQQRLALAKVILNKSDILLLDEPTKGFDKEYKRQFVKLLRNLKSQGKTIIIVSHDVEFCAEAADRCALFFDGDIVSENEPHKFFSGNGFYTTAANRMSRGIVENIITADELVAACSGKIKKTQGEYLQEASVKVCEDMPNDRKKNMPLLTRQLVMVIMILLAVPFTIYAGIYFLGDQKFLFISLLVLLECMLPFMLLFEGRKPQARELVMIAVICAICIAGRGLFYMFPEFKPVVALVVISGAALGAETGFLVGAVTMLVSNIMFGQGPWTPWQMFALGLTGFISGLIFYNKRYGNSPVLLSLYGMMAALLVYGGIMNFGSAVMSYAALNKETIMSFYIAGLPIDSVRAAATFVFTLFLAKPVIEKIERTRIKYGLF
ncbi:MAG: ATP-binding cassette domain-containing protein [Eubacteriales bacterium]|nr:ATP-binding cassette domain-containing protein [Eubacteriales bacterium]